MTTLGILTIIAIITFIATIAFWVIVQAISQKRDAEDEVRWFK